jgi:hypothetical protein
MTLTHNAYARVDNRFVRARDLADLPYQPADTPIPAGSVAPSYRQLSDPLFAADISGAVTAELVKKEYAGTALGIVNDGATEQNSNCAVVTDANGNTYFLFVSPTQQWSVFWSYQLMGPEYYLYKFDGFTGGDFNKNQDLWQGRTNRQRTDDRQISGFTSKAGNPFDLLRDLEATGRKFDKPVVILVERTIITFESVIGKALPIILAIAKPFATTFLGIPPNVFDVISASVTALASGQKVTLDTLVNAASLIAPESIRQYIAPAKAIYNDVHSGNYLGAAEKLGLPVQEYNRYFRDVLAGDFGKLLNTSRLPYRDMFSTVQNIQNFDVMNAVRGQALTGTILDYITEFGTATKVPAIQNLLAVSTAPTMLSTVPKIQEITQQILHQTADVTNVDEHKALVQSALGFVFGGDALDDITERAMIERAIQNAVTRGGNAPFVMPMTIPQEKRYRMGEEIAKAAGVTVFVDATDDDGAITREELNYSTQEAFY